MWRYLHIIINVLFIEELLDKKMNDPSPTGNGWLAQSECLQFRWNSILLAPPRAKMFELQMQERWLPFQHILVVNQDYHALSSVIVQTVRMLQNN